YRGGFLNDVGETEVGIEQVETTLGDILPHGDCDQPGVLTPGIAIHHSGIGNRRHKDIAVSEKEIIRTHKRACVLGCAAGAILNNLAGIGYLKAKVRTVPEVTLDRVGAPSGDDADLVNAGRLQAFKDVLEDRTPL